MTAFPARDLDAMQVEFARALTGAVVPNELPFFDKIVAATKEPPPKRKKDIPLGFGVSAGDLAAVTLVLIDLAKPILLFIWENAKDATGALIKDTTQDARTLIVQKVHTWLDHKLNGRPPFVISSANLATLITTVEQKAAALNLDAATTSRLSDTLRTAFTQK